MRARGGRREVARRRPQEGGPPRARPRRDPRGWRPPSPWRRNRSTQVTGMPMASATSGEEGRCGASPFAAMASSTSVPASRTTREAVRRTRAQSLRERRAPVPTAVAAPSPKKAPRACSSQHRRALALQVRQRHDALSAGVDPSGLGLEGGSHGIRGRRLPDHSSAAPHRAAEREPPSEPTRWLLMRRASKRGASTGTSRFPAVPSIRHAWPWR